MSVNIVLPWKFEHPPGPVDCTRFLAQLESVPKRKIAFFDESISGFIIYHDTEVPATKRSTAYLDVAIVPADTVEEDEEENGTENGNTTTNGNGPESNYSILDVTLNESDIVFNGFDESNKNYYIVWGFEIPITYPRRKSPNPRILLSCFLHDNDELHTSEIIADSDTASPISEQSDEILPDFVSNSSRNLFAELNNQVSFNSSTKPFELSSSVIDPEDSHKRNSSVSASSLTPASQKPAIPETEEITIDTTSKDTLKASLSIPVSVSLVIKIKSTKPAGRNNILLATLNIESSEELIRLSIEKQLSHTVYNFKILSLSMEFKYGVIKEFKTEDYKYPISFRLGDSINLTYKLLNNEFLDKELKNLDSSGSSNLSFSKPINIKLVSQVQTYDENSDSYQDVSGIITTNWSPYLDFSIIAPPINNSLKTSSNYSQMQSQPGTAQQGPPALRGPMSTRKSALMNNIYKLKSQSGTIPSPKITHSTGSLNNGVLTAPTGIKKVSSSILGASSSSSSVTVNLTTSNNSTLSGLKLTFKGRLDIKLGEIIIWKVQAINNSPNKLNLSLIVQNPINFNPIYSSSAVEHNTSSSNLLNSESNADEKHVDDIIVFNKLQLYSSYNALKLNTNGIIILNNDIRIGPLESGTVFETELKLIGISKGIFNLDGIKIFDINSGDGLDFGKLVEIFVI